MLIKWNLTGRDWMKNGFYTSMNPLNRKLGTSFFAVVFKILDTDANFRTKGSKLELYEMSFIFVEFIDV